MRRNTLAGEDQRRLLGKAMFMFTLIMVAVKVTEGVERLIVPHDLSPCWGWELFLLGLPEAVGDAPMCGSPAQDHSRGPEWAGDPAQIGKPSAQTLRLPSLTPLAPSCSVLPPPSIFRHSTPFIFLIILIRNKHTENRTYY